MTWDDVGAILARLPGTSAGTSYGAPAFRAGKTFLTRLREPDVVVLPCEPDERDLLVEADPDAFFVTDHYRGHPYVLARLSRAHPATVERLLVQAWRRLAPKRSVDAYDKAQEPHR